MLVTPEVFDDPDGLGVAAATLIADRLAAAAPGRSFLLGCPGGRSPLPVYRHLAQEASRRRLDLSRLVVVMMDEYVEQADGPGARSRRFAPVAPTALHSCRRFGAVEIVGRLNAGLPPAHHLPTTSLWLPDPARPEAYEDRLAAAGGVDVFLLASGASDGHIAFNPPGSAGDSTTRVVQLPDSTRRDNLATFSSFERRLDRVPRFGVTVGIATIREQSREVVMIVHGRDKRLAARRLTTAEGYQADWPATVFADCRSPHLFVDREAHDNVQPAPQRGIT